MKKTLVLIACLLLLLATAAGCGNKTAQEGAWRR